MSGKKGNVLKEAMAEAESLKDSARAAAEKVLQEHFRDQLKNLVETEMNEMADEDTDKEDELEENMVGGQDHLDMDYPYTEGLDDLDFDMGDDDEAEPDEDDDLEEGYSEADLEEAVMAALQEVEHGGLGEMVPVASKTDPDGDPADSKGLEDLDSKEDGWEAKKAPKATATSIYGGGTYHEGKKVKGVAKLVAENAALKKEVRRLKKAQKALASAVNESKTFNAKLLYTHRLLQNEGLSLKVKRTIVEAMDKAENLREAKNIYATWEKAINVMSEKADNKRQSLSETLGSTGIKDGSGVQRELLAEESAPFSITRMQRLAGIIKD